MKRTNFVYVSVIFFLLVGCAKRIYVHPTKSVQDFEHDKYECKIIAEQSASNLGMPGNPFHIIGEMDECLTKKFGWTLQQAASNDTKLERAPYNQESKNTSEFNGISYDELRQLNQNRKLSVGDTAFLMGGATEYGVYESTNPGSRRIGKVSGKNKLTIKEIRDDWVMIDAENVGIGWIRADLLK